MIIHYPENFQSVTIAFSCYLFVESISQGLKSTMNITKDCPLRVTFTSVLHGTEVIHIDIKLANVMVVDTSYKKSVMGAAFYLHPRQRSALHPRGESSLTPRLDSLISDVRHSTMTSTPMSSLRGTAELQIIYSSRNGATFTNSVDPAAALLPTLNVSCYGYTLSAVLSSRLYATLPWKVTSPYELYIGEIMEPMVVNPT